MKVSEVTYSSLLKSIHPDLNHNINDSHIKIKLLKEYKSDTKKLIDLAYSWGLIEDIESLRFSSMPIEPFMLVWASINKTPARKYLVVDVRFFDGYIDIVLYDYDTYSYITVTRNNIYDQNRSFHIIEDRPEQKHCENIIYSYLEKTKER